MILRSALKEIDGIPGIRFGEKITLEDVKTYLVRELDDTGYEIIIENSTVGTPGGFFKNAVEEPCLVIYNKEHKEDYFNHCITLRYAGKFTNVMVHYHGSSTLTQIRRKKEQRTSSESGLFSNIIGYATNMDEQAFEAEYDYYNIVESTILSTLT